MSKQETIYVGSGKKRKDDWITATVSVDKFRDHIQEYRGTKFIKLNINIKDKPDQYGKDVSISINQYEPEKKDDSDDLPF